MSVDYPSGLGAGVIVLENPHADPVTVAFSALDAAKARLFDGSTEITRLHDKVARAQADVDAAVASLSEAVVAHERRLADVEAAQAALDAAMTADPALASDVTARHQAAHNQQMAELADRLAQLKES